VNRFDAIIFDVRTNVTEVDEQVRVVDAQASNETTLIIELRGLVAHIEFPRDCREALLTGDLSNAMVLNSCVDAVKLLQEKRAANLSPGLTEMAAVKQATQEQRGLESHFAKRFEQFFVRFVLPRELGAMLGCCHRTFYTCNILETAFSSDVASVIWIFFCLLPSLLPIFGDHIAATLIV
jgi:hypothetical protein